jgi:hypothetical protein
LPYSGFGGNPSEDTDENSEVGPVPQPGGKGGKTMSGYGYGYGYGFGLRRLLIFLLVIATIFALVCY